MSENTTKPGAGDAGRGNRGAGMLFALVGFALLSCGDGLIKSTAGQWPGMAVAALRFTLGAIGLGLVLLIREGPQGFRFPRPRVQLARGFFLAGATVTFFSSIFLMRWRRRPRSSSWHRC